MELWGANDEQACSVPTGHFRDVTWYFIDQREAERYIQRRWTGRATAEVAANRPSKGKAWEGGIDPVEQFAEPNLSKAHNIFAAGE
jgi:hypothetical protein